MKASSAIERGTRYFCVKLGAIVTAIGQVAVVKGLAMWEVERLLDNGTVRRMIVPARALRPLPSGI